MAAFTSRSWVAPQRHVQVRTFSGIPSRRAPQAEQSLEDGNQRSTTIRSRPYQAALYSSMPRQLPPGRVADGAGKRVVLDHVADGQVLDHDRLVFANEPSGQLVQVVPAPVGDPGVHPGDLAPGLVPVRRALRLLAGQQALRPGEPGTVAALVPRVGDLLPGGQRDQVIVSPTSMPTTASVAGRRWTVTSHSRDTNQRPAASCETVTVDGLDTRRAAAGTRRCPAARPSSPASAGRRGSGTPPVVYSADSRRLASAT